MGEVICPQCQAVNEVDFGLTPCVNCGTMLLPVDEGSPSPPLFDLAIANGSEPEANDPQPFEENPALPENFDASSGEDENEPPAPSTVASSLQNLISENEDFSNLSNEMPFTYEVRLSELHLPERLRIASQITTNPMFQIREEMIEHLSSSGEMILRGLNTFQASSIVRDALRSNIPTAWKQIF